MTKGYVRNKFIDYFVHLSKVRPYVTRGTESFLKGGTQSVPLGSVSTKKNINFYCFLREIIRSANGNDNSANETQKQN